jgi:hypothetical protein
MLTSLHKLVDHLAGESQLAPTTEEDFANRFGGGGLSELSMLLYQMMV